MTPASVRTKLGPPVAALVRLRYPNATTARSTRCSTTAPEIVEAHHVTGEDRFVLTVRARSMRHLEEVTGRIGGLGGVTTSVVYSTPLPRRSVIAGAVQGTGAGGADGAEPRRR